MQRHFPIADGEASANAQGAGGALDGDGAGPLDRSREDFGNHPPKQARISYPSYHGRTVSASSIASGEVGHDRVSAVWISTADLIR